MCQNNDMRISKLLSFLDRNLTLLILHLEKNRFKSSKITALFLTYNTVFLMLVIYIHIYNIKHALFFTYRYMKLIACLALKKRLNYSVCQSDQANIKFLI